MRVKRWSLLALAAVLSLAAAARAEESAHKKVLGTWKLKLKVGDQVFEPELKLEEKDKKLTGTYSSERLGKQTPNEIAFKDGKLTFKIEAEVDGNKFSATYTAKVKDDTLEGDVEIDIGGNAVKADLEGKREKK